MIRWLPLTIVLLACFSQGARAADGALFLNGEGFQDLEGHLSLWRDPSKEATLQEALAAQEAGAFSPIPGNLGLGLYLVRRIVESHGGSVAFRPGRSEAVALLLWLPKGAP